MQVAKTWRQLSFKFLNPAPQERIAFDGEAYLPPNKEFGAGVVGRLLQEIVCTSVREIETDRTN